MGSEVLENFFTSCLESKQNSIAKTASLYRSLQQPATALESVNKDVTTKEIQYQLLRLRHTYWSCKSKAICLLLQCKLTHQAIYHLKNCSLGYECPFPFCSSSQKAIAHWKQCTHSNCYICVSLKIFTAASHNQLSVVNTLKLILSVLGYRIIKDSDQSKVDVLEQVVEILKSRIIEEQNFLAKFFCIKTARIPEAINWLIIRNLFHYLKCKITTDKLDIYLLLEVTIVSKYKTTVHDCSENPYADIKGIRKFEDKDFEPLVNAFGFKIIKKQAHECEHSGINVLKQAFNAFQSEVTDDDSKDEIPFRFFNSLKLIAEYGKTDLYIISQNQDASFVKSMLDDLGWIIEQDKVPYCRMPVSQVVKKTFDGLDLKIIRDEEDRMENLPTIDIPKPFQLGVIELDPLDLLVYEIDRALNSSSFQNIALSEKMDTTVIYAEKTKKWHQKFTTDFRNKTLDRLVDVIYPNSDVDVRREELILKAKLIMYARQVEKDIYEEANSVNEYQCLLAEKFSQYET